MTTLVPDYKNSTGLWVPYTYREDSSTVLTVSGSKWKNLKARCKTGSAQQRNYPAYVGCVNGFKDFQEFANWHVSQPGYGARHEVDKDLLVCGNKVYSAATCLLIPKQINSLLLHRRRKEHGGDLPPGVHWEVQTKKFRAQCRYGSVAIPLGRFKTPAEAFAAYKECKEAILKVAADEWKDVLDPRAYAALYAFTVSENM